MKPAPFDYFAPDTVDEALALLREHGDDCKILAGGQSLVPLMNLRLAQPSVLIDVNRVTGLDQITMTDDGVELGTMVRQRSAEKSGMVKSRLPLLHEALPFIGHEAIRARGTVGGSVAHSDPAAEIPLVLVTLNADIVLGEAGSQRVVPASKFFSGYLANSMTANEMITHVRVPAQPGVGSAFREISRRHGDFGIIAVAVVLDLNESDLVRRVSIGFAGVAETPLRIVEVESAMIGQAADSATFAAAAAAAAASLEPPTDLHGTGDYRRHLCRIELQAALATAASRYEIGVA